MIHWYGERGVVNAMVTHLQANGAGRAFVQSIHWANPEAPDWVKNVTDVAFIVEPGLADFGSPDLILICTIRDENRPRCVFVEAKVVPYAASAMPNEPGMAAEGYNSSINGQLALKFRFAKSLAASAPGVACLSEPAVVHLGYQVGLSDPKGRPRRLQKRAIIEQILFPHNLLGLPIDRFAFVALTWDDETFFHQDDDRLPKFFDEPNHDCYEAMASQIGWIGYRCLDDIDGLQAAIEPALTLMVGALAPRQLPDGGDDWQPLAAQPIANMPPRLQQLTQQLGAICVNAFGAGCVRISNGSISVSPIGRVEAKIVPRQEAGQELIYAGVRPEWPLGNWTGLATLERRFGGQSFVFVRLGANQEATTAVEGVIESLSEALMQNVNPDE